MASGLFGRALEHEIRMVAVTRARARALAPTLPQNRDRPNSQKGPPSQQRVAPPRKYVRKTFDCMVCARRKRLAEASPCPVTDRCVNVVCVRCRETWRNRSRTCCCGVQRAAAAAAGTETPPVREEPVHPLVAEHAREVNDEHARLHIDATTVSCPTCRSPIEKDGMCHMMRCARCNTRFCWLCGMHRRDGDFETIHSHNRRGTTCSGQIVRDLCGSGPTMLLMRFPDVRDFYLRWQSDAPPHVVMERAAEMFSAATAHELDEVNAAVRRVSAKWRQPGRLACWQNALCMWALHCMETGLVSARQMNASMRRSPALNDAYRDYVQDTVDRQRLAPAAAAAQ